MSAPKFNKKLVKDTLELIASLNMGEKHYVFGHLFAEIDAWWKESQEGKTNAIDPRSYTIGFAKATIRILSMKKISAGSPEAIKFTNNLLMSLGMAPLSTSDEVQIEAFAGRLMKVEKDRESLK